jgi:hypothetical protein
MMATRRRFKGFEGGVAVGYSKVFSTISIGLALAACAGRDPQPVASVQPQDLYSDCTMIRAEIDANNAKAKELADEHGLKVAQNVGAGLAGVVIWPIWFGMDFKGAAEKEASALQARQEYLTTLATERCAPGYRPPPPPGSYGSPQAYAPQQAYAPPQSYAPPPPPQTYAPSPPPRQ